MKLEGTWKNKVTCTCEDWKKSSQQVFDAQVRDAIQNQNTYTGNRFLYCPWCGKKLSVPKVGDE